MASIENLSLDDGREPAFVEFYEDAVILSQEGDFVVLDRTQWLPLLIWMGELPYGSSIST